MGIRRMWWGEMRAPAALAILVLSLAPTSQGYSVLAHEAIVDSAWSSIEKVLLKRFPGATPEELKRAHAHAYGGSLIQDMGYYPFSSHFFSDLTHYVRSGDFPTALLREARDINEYAFALGALEHYAADTNGHRMATNPAVAMLYPKLRRKFGDLITYWDHPVSHVRTEFSFDVLQVAQGRYAPEGYHGFIGFEVSKPVLERAFLSTYGLEVKDVLGNTDLAFGSYRRGVSLLIPAVTRVAWSRKQNELKKNIPGITRDKFLYNLSRASYEKDWGNQYRKPGFLSKLAAFFFRILPKVGPLAALKFRTPTPEVERMFMASFNVALDNYRGLLEQAAAGTLQLRNANLDLGREARPGEYKGADEAYARLVRKLAEHDFSGVGPELRQNILAYYAASRPPVEARSSTNKRREWEKLEKDVERLKAAR